MGINVEGTTEVTMPKIKNFEDVQALREAILKENKEDNATVCLIKNIMEIGA